MSGYGLDADEQAVAEAVRASMSVPAVFDPVKIGEGDRAGLLVDGECDERRTIRVDASAVLTLDVRMTTEAFLAGYDHGAWVADRR